MKYIQDTVINQEVSNLCLYEAGSLLNLTQLENNT